MLFSKESKRHFGRLLDLFAVGEFQEGDVVAVSEESGEEDGRERLAVGVVFGGHVVVRLPGEGDFVFGGGEFLRELGHVGGRFEVGVGFHGDLELAEGGGEGVFGGGEGFGGVGGGEVSGEVVEGGVGALPGVGDGLEGFALVGQVCAGGFHEVGDEVVPALELDVDLGEGVFAAVFVLDEGVVDDGRVDGEDDDDSDGDPDFHDGSSPGGFWGGGEGGKSGFGVGGSGSREGGMIRGIERSGD